MSKNLWWGYQHQSGSLQVKRYFDKLDIQEAEESPFCEIVKGPFLALDRENALITLKTLLNLK